MAHSRTRDLPAVCRRADIVVAAVGRAEMIRGDWVKPGAAVIDVGISGAYGGHAAAWESIEDDSGRRELQAGGQQTEKFARQAASKLGLKLGGGE